MQGGCHCTSIRYEADQVYDADYCHCTICRRTVGAPVFTWVDAPVESFRLIRGEPSHYDSSDHTTRYFCASCGSHLYTMERHHPALVSISIGTLDRAADVEAEAHIDFAEKLDGFDLRDEFPRYEQGTMAVSEKR